MKSLWNAQDRRALDARKTFARDRSAPWPAHPFFGLLGPHAWGVLTRRHFDHHLRQFGV
jgi:hypothetical protein